MQATASILQPLLACALLAIRRLPIVAFRLVAAAYLLGMTETLASFPPCWRQALLCLKALPSPDSVLLAAPRNANIALACRARLFLAAAAAFLSSAAVCLGNVTIMMTWTYGDGFFDE